MSSDDAALLNELATPHRANAAFWRLLARGRSALPSIMRGLTDERADVRFHCCRLLDHLVATDGFDALLDMLDDPDARVRSAALHSLTCDRCKDGVCLPTDGALLERALALMAGDPNRHVRAMAIEAVARSVHTSPSAEAAIVAVASSDPSPAVRKKARWFVPGGPVYERTRLEAERRRPKAERRRAA